MYALALARNTLAGLLVGNPAYLRGGRMFSATSRHPHRAGVRQSRGLGAETVIPFHQGAAWSSLAVLLPGFLAEDSAVSFHPLM